ncbi:MAG TPA: hypothetical protein VM871_10315 [Flavisolibacter sp.]|nr:hypothetical protein [Flavisolibacter sp.]
MYQTVVVFFLLLCGRAGAQTPVNDLLKKYATQKGIAVEQTVLANLIPPVEHIKINALAKTVTFDEDYPKVLSRFQKGLEEVLLKNYTFVSFTKDVDNEKIVMFYYRIFGTLVELIVLEKEDDGEDKNLTVHLTDFHCSNVTAEELKKLPFTIKVNGFEGVVQPDMSGSIKEIKPSLQTAKADTLNRKAMR